MDKFELSKVTQENILSSYLIARTTWAGDLIQWDICGLLLNFDCDINCPIRFENGVKVVRFLPEKKNVLWRRLSQGWTAFDSGSSSISIEEITNAKFRIVASVTTDPEDNCLPNDQIVNISAWQLLLSLRLLKRGLIGLSRIVSIPNFDQRHGLVNASYSLADFSIEISLRERNSAILYSLKWGELPFLMKIIESLNAGSEKDRQEMQIAFSRFNLAYQRDRAEDRIIDFTVALENLLLWGTDQELQYRLTLRGAAILAKTENPSEVKTRLEAVYFVRSKIVHEGRTLQDFVNDKTLSKRFQKLVPGKQPQDLPEICEDITRSIINFYLEHLAQGKSIEAIHSDIDLKIINGLSVTDAKDNEGV